MVFRAFVRAASACEDLISRKMRALTFAVGIIVETFIRTASASGNFKTFAKARRSAQMFLKIQFGKRGAVPGLQRRAAGEIFF